MFIVCNTQLLKNIFLSFYIRSSVRRNEALAKNKRAIKFAPCSFLVVVVSLMCGLIVFYISHVIVAVMFIQIKSVVTIE